MTQPQLIGIIITAAIQIIIFVIIILMYSEVKLIRKNNAPNVTQIEELIFLGNYEEAKNTLLRKVYRDAKTVSQDHLEPVRTLEQRYQKYFDILEMTVDYHSLIQNLDKPYTESISEKK